MRLHQSRFGAGGGGIGAGSLNSSAAAAAPAPQPVLEPIKEGAAGPDWSWWRERSVLLALSLLDAASERERAFVDQWRARVTAGGLDDDDGDGVSFGGGVVVGGGGMRGGVRRGGGRGSLAPPAYLGNLLSEGNTIAAVARCVIMSVVPSCAELCLIWVSTRHYQ